MRINYQIIWRSSVLSHWGWLKGKPKRL